MSGTLSDQSSISKLNRGPITTVFSPPTSCTATLTIDGVFTYNGHFADRYFDPSCSPLGTLSTSDLATANWGAYYYSPAICPRGWSAVTTFNFLYPINGVPSYMTIHSGTTAALCYPLWYSYSFDAGHICTSPLISGRLYMFSSRGGSAFLTTVLGGSVIGDGIPILWQASDEAVLSRAMLTSSSSSLQTFTSTSGSRPSTSTATNVPSTPEPSGSGGLSIGAKIGIGISIPIVVIAALVLGFIWGKKRTSRAITDSAMFQQAAANDQPILEQPATGGQQMQEANISSNQYYNQTQLPVRS